MAMSEPDIGLALVNIVLLGLLFVVAIAIARLRSLFAIVMLSGIYSLVSAAWYVAVDAVDVGFTEAAVGAGMSTAVLLGAMLLTPRTGIENVVTPVLGSYRGFDTLGETTVVFVAGIAVALLLGFGERSLAETIRNEDKTLPKASKTPEAEDEETDS